MAMQQLLLGLGGALEPFWISELWDDNAADKIEHPMGVGEYNGTIYIGGGQKDQVFQGTRFFVAAYDSEDGSIDWHKTWGVTNDAASYGRSMVTDSNGDCHLYGMYSVILKINGSNGNVIHARKSMSSSYAYNGGFGARFLDVGTGEGRGLFGSFDGNPWFHSLNPGGTHSNCHRKIHSFSGEKPTAVGLKQKPGSTGRWNLLLKNLPTPSTGGNRNSALVKQISETGSVIYWEREIYYPTTQSGSNWGFEPFSLDVDSDSNIYVVGEGMFGNDRPSSFFISKWNDSGTHQWIVKYGDGSSGGVDATNRAWDCRCDSSNNLYVIGQTFGGNNNGAVTGGHPAWVLAKFNSSGALQWGRYIKLTTSNDYWNDRIELGRMAISGDDKAVILFGNRFGSNISGKRGVTMKLDTKGPKTGSWSSGNAAYTIGDMPTSGSYAWTASTVSGYSEREQTDGTWTNYSRTTGSLSDSDDDINWASNTVLDVT